MKREKRARDQVSRARFERRHAGRRRKVSRDTSIMRAFARAGRLDSVRAGVQLAHDKEGLHLSKLFDRVQIVRGTQVSALRGPNFIRREFSGFRLITANWGCGFRLCGGQLGRGGPLVRDRYTLASRQAICFTCERHSGTRPGHGPRLDLGAWVRSAEGGDRGREGRRVTE